MSRGLPLLILSPRGAPPIETLMERVRGVIAVYVFTETALSFDRRSRTDRDRLLNRDRQRLRTERLQQQPRAER